MRVPTSYPTTMHLTCKVRGCGARFEIPVVYRLELVEHSTATLSNPRSTFVDTRVVVDEPATLAHEAPLRQHLDEHAAAAETGVDDAPPVLDPPSWHEVEWCDAGGSCEHDTCLTALEVDDEPDGWRSP